MDTEYVSLYQQKKRNGCYVATIDVCILLLLLHHLGWGDQFSKKSLYNSGLVLQEGAL